MSEPLGRDRIVLVANSDSGLGRAAVERLADEDVRVHALADEASRRPRAGVRACLDAFGRLDALFIPSPDAVRGPVPESSYERYRAAGDEGLRTSFFLAQAAARAMTEGGRICIAAPRRSSGDQMPAPATMVEGGLVAMIRLLAAELGPSGIAVNGVCPIGRDADPRAIASALVFLASADASYVSGVLVPVAG
jgi:NAD(P)-dependent dehydrogenase (short-subunit alcohol dehydrogenase family)